MSYEVRPRMAGKRPGAGEPSGAAGAAVVAAATLVDRSGLAGARFEELGVDYFPMATYLTMGIDRVVPDPAPSGQTA